MSKHFKIIPFLIVIQTLISIISWSGIDILSTFFIWTCSYILIFSILLKKKKYFHPNNKKDYYVITIYFIWAILGIIRGIFTAENYWEWKQLSSGVLSLSLPLFVYIFINPDILQDTIKTWLKYIIPVFFIFIWILPVGSFHFYLAPIFLLACFTSVFTKKWKLLFLFLLIIILTSIGDRAQIIKAIATLLLAFSFLFRRYISLKILRLVYWTFYLLPIILLFLGISGSYNIFEAGKNREGKYVQKKIINGEIIEEDATSDTRTFIYQEVITSAIRHNYIIWGRTPARGNDSMSFGSLLAEDLGTGKYERFMNEVCHPNVFTWLGLLGLIPWCLIYLKGSYLAIYKSNNIYIKYIGIFTAFHWFLGWIEDVNNFDITSITIWISIAMGLSESFRKMNNQDFKKWLLNCLPIK